MIVTVVFHKKEVLRPVDLPTETKVFDLSTWDGLCEYNSLLAQAIKDGREMHMEGPKTDSENG